MNPRRHLMRFCAIFGLATLLLLPLRLVFAGLDMADRDLVASELAGSLWSGQLRHAQWRGQPLGTLGIRLQPLALLTGVRRFEVAGTGFSMDLLQGRLRGVSDANGEVAIDHLETWPGIGLQVSLREASLLFAEGRCRHAGGSVRVIVRLAADPESGFPLDGNLTCAQDTGRLVLRGASTTLPLTLEAVLEIESDGRYRLQSLARSDAPSTRLALLASGFQQGPTGLSRVDSGVLTD